MNKVFLFLLLIIAVLQLHNLINYPTNKGFDALNHRDYIEFIKNERRIPLPSEGWELYQPLLYYLLASFFPNLVSAKLIGFFSWIILVYISFYLYKKRFSDLTLALLGTLIVSSLPVVLYLTPAIGNEFFSGVLISVSMTYFLTRRQNPTLNAKIILGFLIGLSLLTKATSIVFLAALILSELFLQRKSILQTVKFLLIPLIMVLILSGWFYGRNLILYKNPFVASVDFPQFQDRHKPSGRDLKFFTDLTGFLKMDLYKSQHYSFIPGTYFSWFYDGHNVMLPVQHYSKKGILLVIFSFPLFILSAVGFLKEIRMVSKKNLLLIIYSVLLFTSYLLYNLKLPFYSTVKGAFLVSLAIPFGYFFLKGLEKYRSKMPAITFYLILYIGIIVMNFWIMPIWYTPSLSK